MIVDPPFDAGAVNATLALPFPAVAVPIVGGPGTVAGVAVAAEDAALLPEPLVATTLHEYSVPLVRPVTVIGLALALPVLPVPLAEHVAV